MDATGENHTLTIEPQAWRIDAHARATLLEAALLDGIILPASCRNGTCRTCICLLREGRVRYEIEWPGLSAEEKQEGYILPCVAYPESDVVIVVPGARREAY